MSYRPSQITPNLWAFTSRSMAYNAGVYISGGQALLIDPGPHPDETDALAAFVAAQGASLAAIVLTHSHWDHILGPERLPPAPIVAQAGYAEAIARDRDYTLWAIARWERREGHARPAPFVYPAPSVSFGDSYDLGLGDSRLRLLHIPGHASDQLAIFDPEHGALWAADTLSDLEIPFVSDSLSTYQRTLERLAALPARALVPGHGAPTSDPAQIQARIAADRGYLAALRDRVGATLAAGGDADAALAACANLLFRDKGENRRPHRLNVESVFLELGGAGDPERIGWHQKHQED
jgi:glyoxylase-like metal-dependent hydrolase (beta-lactamase superfamily II)